MELWYSEFHTENVKLSVRVDRQLFSGESEYQRIDVFESAEFGKFVALDGEIVFSEKDEFVDIRDYACDFYMSGIWENADTGISDARRSTRNNESHCVYRDASGNARCYLSGGSYDKIRNRRTYEYFLCEHNRRLSDYAF